MLIVALYTLVLFDIEYEIIDKGVLAVLELECNRSLFVFCRCYTACSPSATARESEREIVQFFEASHCETEQALNNLDGESNGKFNLRLHRSIFQVYIFCTFSY